MIIDITVEDNDFTYIFHEYFRKYTYRYRLDIHREDMKDIGEYRKRFKEYEEIRERLQENMKKALTDVSFVDKAIKVLREDIRVFVNDRYHENRDYIMKNLKIRLGDTYKIKWQNGEHIYTNFGYETQQFIVIQ